MRDREPRPPPRVLPGPVGPCRYAIEQLFGKPMFSGVGAGMRVMGVDPGLTRCGLSVVESGRGRNVVALDVDVVRTPSDAPLSQRLLTISEAVEHWLATHHPDVMAIERVFSQQNVMTVMGTAQAGGVIALAAARRGIDVHFHTPSEVKAAVTGSGTADKAQVTAMVTRILALQAKPTPADAADAWRTLIWFLVVKGDYKRVEKVFLAASVFYIAYIVTGVLSQPSWHDALVATVELPRGSIWHDKSYIYMIVGVIGTTISPWMQFYLQSSIVEKGVTAKSYPASRLDVIIGSFFTNIVAWFIVVACAATLFAHGMGAIREAADAAEAMKPLAGQYAFLLFAIGLFNASLFAASILPLSTAYTVCEGLGLASGLDGGFKDAPVFYWLYSLLVAGGAAAVLFVPNGKLISMVILSQVLNGVLLPLVIIFMLLLINRKDLMGESVNSHWFNAVAWLTAVVVIVLSLVMMFTSGSA